MNRVIITHEIMHYFGAADLYLISNKLRDDTIMDAVASDANYLGSNDIKYLFCMFSNIQTQQQAQEVEEYIVEHLKKHTYSPSKPQKVNSDEEKENS